MDQEFARRYLNEGFSGGEKKRAEVLQLAMLRPAFAILDETDSGLDIDAVRIVSEGVNKVAAKAGTGVLVITHYQRILTYIKPEFVHILFGGKIVENGGPELVEALEREGYDWVRAKYPEAAKDEDELEAKAESGVLSGGRAGADRPPNRAVPAAFLCGGRRRGQAHPCRAGWGGREVLARSRCPPVAQPRLSGQGTTRCPEDRRRPCRGPQGRVGCLLPRLS